MRNRLSGIGMAVAWLCALLAAPAQAASDLAFDPDFAYFGGKESFSVAGNGYQERVVALLPSSGTNAGFWIVSLAAQPLNSSVVLTHVNDQGRDSGTQLTPSLGIINVVAAAIGGDYAHEKIFLLGSAPGGGADFGVECLDVHNGGFFGDCANFSPDFGYTRIDFAQGGTPYDFPACVAYYNGAVYAAGRVNIAPGSDPVHFAIGVVKLSAGSGEVDTSWGNLDPTRGFFVKALNYAPNGADIPRSILVTRPDPNGLRIDVFVAGTSQAGTDDTDGWILAIDDDFSEGGQLDPQWNNGALRRIYYDLGPTNKRDEITAMTQRHNGNLLVTGIAYRDDSNDLILGEIRPDGTLQPSFNGGGMSHSMWTSFNQIPVAIAERPGAGNFVVASTDTYGLAATPLVAGLAQFNPSGTRLMASNFLNYDASDTSKNSTHGGAMFVDAKNRVIFGGWYLATPGSVPTTDTDDEFYAGLRAEDTLFANGFGGSYRD